MRQGAALRLVRNARTAYQKAMRNAWLLLLLWAGCAGPTEVEPEPVARVEERAPLELTRFGPNPGQVRLFLFAPSSPKPGTGLVVALHGCLQTAADFQKTGWSGVAETHGFYVLYVQSSNASGCFRWYEPGHASRGQGESASVVAGVDWVLQRHAVDRRRVFVTGLSAGAAMSAALLASSPDVFSAGALFAGVPAGCAASAADGVKCMAGVDLDAATWARRAMAFWPHTPQTTPRVQVWTGDADPTVAPATARELVEQWTALRGLDAVPEALETVRRGTSEVHGALDVQLVTLAGFGHAVPVATARGCGAEGAFVKEAGLCGAEEAARFFGLLEPAPELPVELLDAGPLHPGVLDAGPLPAQDAGVMTAPADAGFACREATATPTWHVWLRRAEVCGFFRTLACARGSGELLGSTLSQVPVSTWSVDEQVWRAGGCP